jgi:hypothetical protein
MIFNDYIADKSFNVLLDSINAGDQTQESSDVTLTYLDGGKDEIRFGSRKRVASSFRIVDLTHDEFIALNDWLQANLADRLTITQDNNELPFGPAWNTPELYIEVVEAIPIGEERYSQGRNQFAIEIKSILLGDEDGDINVTDDSIYDYAVEVQLSVGSTDYYANTSAELPVTAQPGETVYLHNVNGADPALGEYIRNVILIWLDDGINPAGWIQEFPLNENEVDFWLETEADMPYVNSTFMKKGMTRWIQDTREYQIYDDEFLLNPAYQNPLQWSTLDKDPHWDVPQYKRYVANVAEEGLKNGKFWWSAFADQPTRPFTGVAEFNPAPEFYKSGLIAKNGLDAPNLSTAMEQGPSIEKLEGYTVKLDNSDRFHWKTLGFNFFGARVKLYYIDKTNPLDIKYILVRSGINRTNSFDFNNYVFNVEPELVEFLQKQLPSTTVIETIGSTNVQENEFTGATVPMIYGYWRYAKTLPYARKNTKRFFLVDDGPRGRKTYDSFTINTFEEGGDYPQSGAWSSGINVIESTVYDYDNEVWLALNTFSNSTTPPDRDRTNFLGPFDNAKTFALAFTGAGYAGGPNVPKIRGLTNGGKVFGKLLGSDELFTLQSDNWNGWTPQFNPFSTIRDEAYWLVKESDLPTTPEEVIGLPISAWQVEWGTIHDSELLYDYYGSQNPIVYKFESDLNDYVDTTPALFKDVFGARFGGQNGFDSGSGVIEHNAMKINDLANFALVNATTFETTSFEAVPATGDDYATATFETYESEDPTFAYNSTQGPPNPILTRFFDYPLLNNPLPITYLRLAAFNESDYATWYANELATNPSFAGSFYTSVHVSNNVTVWQRVPNSQQTPIVVAQGTSGNSTPGQNVNIQQFRDARPYGIVNPTAALHRATHWAGGQLNLRDEGIGVSMYYPFSEEIYEKLKGQTDVKILTSLLVQMNRGQRKDVPLTMTVILVHKENPTANITINRAWFEQSDGYGNVMPFVFNNLPNGVTGGSDTLYNWPDLNTKVDTGVEIESYFYPGATDTMQVFAGQDQFGTLPDSLFDPDNYVFEDYDGIEIIFRNKDAQKAGAMDIIFGNNAPQGCDLTMYLLSSQQVEINNDDLFVQTTGRYNRTYNPADQTTSSKIMETPVELINDIYRQVVPSQVITSQNITNEPKWRLRKQVLENESMGSLVLDVTKHAWATLAIDETDGLALKSLDYEDYGVDADAYFTEANILKTTKMPVQYRKMESIIRDYTFNFHRDSASGDLWRTVTVKWDDVTQTLNISGFEGQDAAGTTEARTQMAQSLRTSLEPKFQRSAQYYSTAGYGNSLVTDFDWCYDELTDFKDGAVPAVEQLSDSMYTMFKLIEKTIQFHLFNSWTVEFDTHIKYIIDTDEVTSGRLRIGDYIDVRTYHHSDNNPMRGFVKALKPNFYNGTVRVVLFCPVPPDVYFEFYDPLWDGGITDENYAITDYQHSINAGIKPVYPFADPVVEDTFSDAGSGAIDPNDYTFNDGSVADPQDPNIPY